MNKPDLFIAGYPGCGKSHFGRWLEKEHGYLHIDFEKEQNGLLRAYGNQLFRMIDIRDPVPLLESLKKQSKPIIFNWGFPVGCMDVAASLAHQLSPYWFRADLPLARDSFLKRADVPLAAFEKQTSDISKHSFAIDSIFGARIIDTILPDGSKVACDRILEIIMTHENENGA